jgi:hypothetical protein
MATWIEECDMRRLRMERPHHLPPASIHPTHVLRDFDRFSLSIATPQVSSTVRAAASMAAAMARISASVATRPCSRSRTAVARFSSARVT